jgi:predicted dehydrogenase
MSTAEGGADRGPADEPVRVGLVGAGLIATYHAIQLNLATEANRIVAVHDPDRERAAGLAGGQGAEVVDSAEAVAAASDAVFVCTWTAAHHGAVSAALGAGRPVFCEKPLSVDLASADALTAAVVASGLPNMVGLVLRSSPAFLALREWLRDPADGRVMAVVFRDDQYIPTQGMYASTWRGDPRLAGSGTLLEHSIHDLDILEWLLGPVTTVSAHQSFVHGIDGIEDVVTTLVRFADGATGSLCSVWHDVLARPSQRRIEIFRERALLTLEGDAVGPVRRQTDDGEVSLEGEALLAWLQGRGVVLRSAEDRFLAAVRAHRSGGVTSRLRPDVTDALRAHVVADAVYRSARADGAPVVVPPTDPSTDPSTADGH